MAQVTPQVTPCESTLHPKLKVALTCLDLKLESELAQYRTRKTSQHTPALPESMRFISSTAIAEPQQRSTNPRPVDLPINSQFVEQDESQIVEQDEQTSPQAPTQEAEPQPFATPFQSLRSEAKSPQLDSPSVFSAGEGVALVEPLIVPSPASVAFEPAIADPFAASPQRLVELNHPLQNQTDEVLGEEVLDEEVLNEEVNEAVLDLEPSADPDYSRLDSSSSDGLEPESTDINSPYLDLSDLDLSDLDRYILKPPLQDRVHPPTPLAHDDIPTDLIAPLVPDAAKLDRLPTSINEDLDALVADEHLDELSQPLGDIEDYLASSEALLKNVGGNRQESPSHPLKMLLSPWGLISATGLILSVIGSYLILNPEFLDQRRFSQASAPASPAVSTVDSNAASAPVSPTAEAPKNQPDLSAQEFQDLNVSNLGHLNPTASPSAQPNADGSAMAPGLPDAVNPTAAPDAAQASASAAASEAAEPGSDDFYYVIADYTGDQSLKQAQTAVPEAYLVNFKEGVKIQFAAYEPNAAADADSLVQALKSQGISASVRHVAAEAAPQ
jgi:hypothetical protein